jgi:hypothetical protein
MPKRKKKAKIPKYGRPLKDVQKDMGLKNYSSNVPLGNTDPTVVRGKLYGNMPNQSRKATGRLRVQKGKRGG